MKVMLPSTLQEFVEDEVKSGRFNTPQDVIAAALAALMLRRRSRGAHSVDDS